MNEILLFTTQFCAKCPGIKKKLQEENMNFKEINAITEKELVDRYGIKSVPSLVVKGNTTDHGETYQVLTGEAIKEVFGKESFS